MQHINIFFLFLISFAYSQEIPNSFYEYKIEKLTREVASNWEENTTFGPIRFSNNINNDSLIINGRFGYMMDHNQRILYAYGHFTYNKYFHGYLYPRIVNDVQCY